VELLFCFETSDMTLFKSLRFVALLLIH